MRYGWKTNILEFTEKSGFYRGRRGVTKNKYRGGDCLKEGFGLFADLRGGAWQGRRGWCFWGGDTPMHTMRI